QSSGVGTYADVAAAIEYCAVNGASVINFSGGGYAESQLLHDAIAYAYGLGDEYGGTILVAAAGNSWYKIDWPFPPQPPTGPMYPACYGFVVGVEATQPGGNNSWFSNFDPSGPILSNDGFYWNEYDYNYEVRAPGSSILSTFPNGGYAVLSGTSMATPIVSAAVSLLKSVHPGESNETIMGKLIQSSHGGVIKLDSLLNWELEPDIHFHELMVVDSLPGSDDDQAVDAGESVEISLVVKNVGGQAENIWAKLRFGEFEDTTTATITKDSSHIGSVSSYALGVGSFDPFEVSFSSGLVNQRHVVFEYELGSGSVSLKSGNFTIVVENGVELNGTIHKLVLDSDAYYLVNEPAVIDTLIIKPGVTVRFSNQMFIMVTEYLSAVGVSDSMITFKGANDAGVRGIIMAEGANSNFEYCIFEDGWGGYTDPPYLVNPKRIHNSIFRNNTYKRPFDLIAGMDVQKNLIENNSYNGYGEHNLIMAWGKADTFRYNLISRNKDTDLAGSIIKFYGNQDLSYMTDNVFVGNTNYGVGTSSWNGWPMGVYTLPHQYWGGNEPDFVRSQILDFYESPDRAVLEPDSILTVPPIEVHGMVTDVAINGISINKYDNAWNHEDGLGAIGVDTMKFEIRFNRPMDISVNPFVTFGVRDPYTQNVVNDQSIWSSDSTLWTAYFITGLETGDGLNRMFVSRAYDMESFMIPIEDTRFEFYLQAAGALSVNFQAVPGIGKVDLDWPPSYTDDVLGYNMYRSLRLNDSNWTVFNIINNALIADSSFTDFSVIPDSAYRYRYTVLGTDFVESDHSRTVPATPFSAANGDANGDLSVNVLDIISMVSYVLEGDSQPFLFDAADLNGDDQVNVLDIISVINIILGNTAKIAAQSGEAIVALDAHELWISSKVSIGGLQLKISGQLENARISTPLGMELTNSMISDGEMIVLLYSMSGQFIKAGSHSVIKIEGASDIIISELIVS
ncbi:MAG: S8 family serine peptidase, partial [Candidatus Marinimicrobia bacterium]|nr:S8 family serine peptidase [Candidatus Neomarinimicrobiota bacterium]